MKISGRLLVVAMLLGAIFFPASQASAYLNAPAEKLTLPQLLKEFKSVRIMKAGRMDLEKGVVLWEFVEQLQGEKDVMRAKHLLRLKDGVPPALKNLKADQQAIFFSQDGFDRGLMFTGDCWYVVGYEADNQCWRIAYTDRWYDFSIAFVGKRAQMIDAIRKLLAGEEAVVQCRAKPKEPALQTVRYSMKRVNEKVVVEATTKPADGNEK